MQSWGKTWRVGSQPAATSLHPEDAGVQNTTSQSHMNSTKAAAVSTSSMHRTMIHTAVQATEPGVTLPRGHVQDLASSEHLQGHQAQADCWAPKGTCPSAGIRAGKQAHRNSNGLVKVLCRAQLCQAAVRLCFWPITMNHHSINTEGSNQCKCLSRKVSTDILQGKKVDM